MNIHAHTDIIVEDGQVTTIVSVDSYGSPGAVAKANRSIIARNHATPGSSERVEVGKVIVGDDDAVAEQYRKFCRR